MFLQEMERVAAERGQLVHSADRPEVWLLHWVLAKVVAERAVDLAVVLVHLET